MPEGQEGEELMRKPVHLLLPGEGARLTACGRIGPELGAFDYTQVDCFTCRRTNAFKDAKAKALKESKRE